MSYIEVIVLAVDGTYAVKRLQTGAGALSAEVRGPLELLPHRKANYSCYVNEEGRLCGLPPNPWAAFLQREGFGAALLVGNAVLCQADRKGRDCDVGESLKLAVTRHYETHFARTADVTEPVRSESSSESDSDSGSDYRQDSSDDESDDSESTL